MREVVRGDKHNLRKSANCKAQISTMCGVNDTDLCVAICRFSPVVFVTSMDADKNRPRVYDVSSIVNGRSGTLNHLLKIVAKGWL